MKTIFYSILVLTMIFSISTFQGCSDDTNPTAPTGPNTSSYIPLGEEYAIGGRVKVFLYSGDSLTTGYNKIYIVLYDSLTNNLITDAHIEFEPVDHGSGAPVENPEQNAVNGVFEGAVVFTEPQTLDDPRHWHFNIMVHNHEAPGEPEGEAEFTGFHIKENPNGFFKIQPDTSTTYTFALITPKAPVNGSNDLEFLVSLNTLPNTNYDPFPWFTFTGMQVENLGGGVSTGNESPNTIGNGHYKGKVNLTSSGTWKVHMLFEHSSIPYQGDFYINLD